MTLVSGDNRSVMPRVMPKVFADMPTPEEVQSARSSRTQVLIIALFLIALLIAAAVGLYLLYENNNKQRDTNATLVETTEKVQGEITRQTALRRQYDEYAVIKEEWSAAQELRRQIAARLAQTGGTAGSAFLTPPASYLRPRVDWTATRFTLEQDLELDRQELETIAKAVDAYGGTAPRDPRGQAVDPRLQGQ